VPEKAGVLMDPMFFFYLTSGAMAFLLVSMIIGRGHQGGHGHGHGWHLGHTAAHGTAPHAPHVNAHSAAARAGGAKAGPENMSIWSFQMLLLFLGGFGIGGYFGSSLLLGFLLTMLMGTASGLALAAAGYFGINFFYRRQGDSNIESREYIGSTGIVVTSIGVGGVGQVRCQIGTSRDTFLARSGDGSAIPINSVVRIVEMAGSTAVVEVADPGEAIDFRWRD